MSTTTTRKTTTTRTRRPAQAAKATAKATAAPTQEDSTMSTTTSPSTTSTPDHKALATKEPTELHERMAAWMTRQSGVKITPKQAQVVTALREAFRTSDEGQDLVLARKAAADRRKAAELKAKKATAAKKIAELQAILDAK